MAGEIKCEQHEGELAALLQLGQRRKSILEIGSRYGGVLTGFHHTCPPDTKIYSIDLGWDVEGCKEPHADELKAAVDWIASQGRHIELKSGDSKSLECIAWAKERAPFDLIFIDGDHSYEGVAADWQNYGALAQIIGFHDIANPNLGVMRLWHELAPQYNTAQWRQKNSIMGIGVIYRDKWWA